MKESEDQVRQIIDTIPTFVWSASPAGSVEFYNRRWLDYTGLTLEQAQDWGWTTAIHPDDQQLLVDYWRTLLVSSEPGEAEARLRRSDGVYRWFLFRATPSLDENGRVFKWYGTNTDIDDRKRGEDELRVAMSERARLAAVRAEIGMALARKDNLRGILDLCAKAMVRHLDAAFARIWTLNRDGRDLELQASAGIYTRLDGRYSRIRLGELKIGLIAQNRKAHLTNDVQNDSRISDRDWARAEKMTSFAGYPLVVEDRIVGVMGMFSRSPLTPSTLETLAFVADGIAQGVERKHAEERLRRSEAYLGEAQRLSQTGSFGWDVSSGELYWSPETFRIFECEPTAKVKIEHVLQRTHPEDRSAVQQLIDRVSRERTEFDFEHRLLMPDGSVKYLRVMGRPSKDPWGAFEFVGAVTDVTERRRAEEVFRASEQSFRLIVDSIPGFVCTLTVTGEIEYVNHQVLEYFGRTLEELKNWAASDAVHTGDLPNVIDTFRTSIETGQPTDVELRLRRADGVYRWFLLRRFPHRDIDGHIVRWYTLHIDIDDLKRAEDALRSSEENIRLTLDSISGLVTTFSASGDLEFANRPFQDYTGRTLEQLKSDRGILHPDDRERVMSQWRNSLATGEPLYAESRLRRSDGVFRWFHLTSLPLRDKNNEIARWCSLITDIDERKRAEEGLRQSEADLLEAQRLTHMGSWKHVLSSGRVEVSPEIHRIFGTNPDEDTVDPAFWFSRIHPEDRKRTQELFAKCEIEKTDYMADYRLLLPDGTIRHQHSVGHPVLSESGELIEFVGTALDTTEQVQARAELEKAFAEIKVLKDQLYRENLALRDEVDRASMFEEIVGNSRELQAVLSRVAKVAPTDSTVLITGETGTGKELIARAIHKRSPRSPRAFVSVNCAALAPSLIASELFGHEKGAFTGAMQRRLGRFELADGGTIFLDEVGELPADTQVALLRVLQEREFERVGGKQSIHVDVRVIAATNRKLDAATAQGAFRADLFYRLNVFPIEVPPLRERKEDVLMLLEYFLDRFAKKVGKKFGRIDRQTLELFRCYDWPGNIRELQNVVERSVILSSSDVFCIDEAWLSTDAGPVPPRQPASAFSVAESSRERQIIEAALAKSRGRVSGPLGAAAKLRIPASTLESKIKRLKIPKSRFKLGSGFASES